MIPAQCKRLIEVDLPIGTISEHALHEQNIRKGHLHTLHVWWATRPLVACRAVILGALLPDPADEGCPEEFRQKASKALDWLNTGKLSDPVVLRQALLDFIGDFSVWESSTDKQLLNTARMLLEAAWPESPLLVVDPFAGIGSIPFEALRLGAEAFAGDLNPVATLLLKTVLEDIPKFGKKLAEDVRRWGNWMEKRVESELQPFYPSDKDGSLPLAYLWARKIRCEGPNCGAELPLVGFLWLSKKEKQKVALRYKGDKRNKKVVFEIFEPNSEDEVQATIVNRFTATCPVPGCNYTTPYSRVVEQLRKQRGGTKLAKMIAVITIKNRERRFRLATEEDIRIETRASQFLEKKNQSSRGPVKPIPNEPTPISRGPGASRAFSIRKYGMETWEDIFNARQALALITFVEAIHDTYNEVLKETREPDYARAITTCLSLAVSGNLLPYLSALSLYLTKCMETAFKPGNALPMRPDFAEANPLIPRLVGGFEYALDQVARVIEREGDQGLRMGTAHQGSATNIPLPDQSVPFVFTDPPYYDAIPYAGLSDFCYVWLKRMVGHLYPELFRWPLTPKKEECILDPGPPSPGEPVKDRAFFENTMRMALTECKRVIFQNGIAVVLFAHKSTAGWEAMLKALVDAGWTVTASWPIATERGARMRAVNSAVLASSVFLVCRPRPISAEAGDWRDVLSELQPRVHVWLERLVKEGIVGADAIFACLGPALEIYSRYNTVETAGGKMVELADKYGQKGELIERGYLSYVWESVAKEALSMIFEGADPAGFEEDSRLTAMWLWTIRTRVNRTNRKESEAEGQREKASEKAKGYALEYDAVRKIAQGLGAHLEELGRPGGIVEVKGNMATLLFVTERREFLFQEPSELRKIPEGQMTLFRGPISENLDAKTVPERGRTTLDRLHQTMLLFGDGKSEALRRFLVDDGVGKDDGFWSLAQALSALYQRNSDEKRWVDGVLSRKKSLGF
jgi:adenine-specific DNA methylase